MKELHDLETYEVSLVPKGANGKKFLVFKDLKGAQGMKDAKSILDWVAKNVNPEKMKEVEKVIKQYDEMGMQKGEEPMQDKHKAALQAIARIASPMKDEVDPGHLVKVLQAAGYDMHKAMQVFGNPDGDTHAPDGEPPHSLHESDEPLQKDHMKAIPEEVLSDMKDVLKAKMNKGHKEDDDEDDDDGDEVEKTIKAHLDGAYGEAEKTYKAHLEKLGYAKYPDMQPRMKSVAKDLPKQVDVSEENHEHGEAQSMDKNVLKSLDLSKVNPKVKTAFEAVFKANEVAIQKAARLEGELKTERETRVDKDLMDRAKGIGHGNIEKHFKIMKSLPAELASEYETEQKSVAERIAKGDLFKETGTGRGGDLPGHDAWAKIEAIATGMVEKSAEKISKADAVEAVLKTAEGKRLYDEYMAAKPGMKV